MPDAWWNTTTGPPGPTLLYDPPWIAYTDYVSTGSVTAGGSAHYADWSGTDIGDPYFGGVPFTSMSGTEITMLCDATVILYLECALQTSTDAVGNVRWDLYGTADDEPFYQWTRSQCYADIRPTAYTYGGFCYETLTAPPVRVPAAATFKLRMGLELSAGTATFAQNRLCLTRIA